MHPQGSLGAQSKFRTTTAIHAMQYYEKSKQSSESPLPGYKPARLCKKQVIRQEELIQ